MNAIDVLRQAEALGLRLEVAGENLAVRPKGRCPEDFVAVLREHKPALLALLNPPCPGWGSIPPSDLTLDPALPRPTTENRERLISYFRRQTRDKIQPLMAWLLRRELAYYEGPGRSWDCAAHAYAAARDAARWQLNRTEAEVLVLLQSCQDSASTFPKPQCPKP